MKISVTLFVLDPAYPVPGTTNMRKCIDCLVAKMKARIESLGTNKENKLLH